MGSVRARRILALCASTVGITTVVLVSVLPAGAATVGPGRGSASGGTAVVVSGLPVPVAVTAGSHTVTLASDGSLYAWGWNIYGQLGDGTGTDSAVPVAVDTSGALAGRTVTQVVAGEDHTVALTSDATLFTWGSNEQGQLGVGAQPSAPAPLAVDTTGVLAGKTITQVAAGDYHTVVLASDGTLYAWGIGIHGQLGDGRREASSVPVAVDTTGALAGKTIKQVVAGDYHTAALASDGTLYTWGEVGASQWLSVPQAVDTSGVLAGQTVTKITAGGGFTVALTSRGKLYAWGDNNVGQLGDGTGTASAVPVPISTSGALGSKTVTQVAAGRAHTVALTSDGSLYTWGNGGVGQMGDGTRSGSAVPVAVDRSGALAGKTITQVAAGQTHVEVLAADGTLTAWGSNNTGQLGSGMGPEALEPVAVTPWEVTGVTFDGVAAQSVTGRTGDGTTTRAVTPPHRAGFVDVQVVLSGWGPSRTISVPRGFRYVDRPTITAPGPGAHLTDSRHLIAGTGVPGDTVTVTADGNPIGQAVVIPDGTWTLVPAVPLDEGTRTLVATSTTPDTSVSDLPSEPVTVIVDAPAVPPGGSDPAATEPGDPGTTEPALVQRTVVEAPRNELAATGSTPAPLLMVGALGVAAGAALVVVARRRRTDTSA